MNRKNNSIFKLLIVLFMIFLSVPHFSGIVILSYGILGETKSTIACENVIQTEEKEYTAYSYNNVDKVKKVQIFNIWLLILAIILFKKYASFFMKMPRKYTLVLLKVRMDN